MVTIKTDFDRNHLPEYFKSLGYKVGAEVGVYKAEYAEKFVKSGLFMYAIDPWMAYQGGGRTQAEQKRQNFIYSHATRVLSPYKNAQLIRATSMDALKYFEDGSLDFVYLDGDHSFKHIAQDIYEWAKKVRKGGVVAGHDYFYYSPKNTNLICQVSPVVDAYIKVMDINKLYIIPENKEAKHKDDRYPSWFFFI